MTEWATNIVSSLGIFGVAFLIAVENLFPPPFLGAHPLH